MTSPAQGPDTPNGCNAVSRYLERWLDEGARSQVDLDQIGQHATQCPLCYARLADFFRTIELPESSYLRETMDELALSVLNLARAIVRDRLSAADDEDDNAVLAITDPGGGSAEENVESGHEMLDDAEDFSGSSVVGGLDLRDVRALLADAEKAKDMRIDLSLDLFRRVTELESRYEAEAWNWIGALHYRQERLDEAEAAFVKVLSLTTGIEEVRAFAHCTLSYIFKHRGDLDRAIREARRSSVLAEEDGKDPYFGRFAELYLRLLRNGPDDATSAAEVFQAIVATDQGRDRFREDIRAAANAPVLAAFKQSELAARFSVDG
ncbi:MAG: hypothetical protein CMJ83_12050 [Planctomycetes bacterium]|jgi:tetratricopeptide (TPR) repeat protein|nr:hypothetical protein [Planctomycetota bacterium]